jgi:uncharacterized protein with PIN domain
MKKPPKARSCPYCGNPLEQVLVCEIIPAAAFVFENGRYGETDLSERLENKVEYEARCYRCNTRLEGTDLDFIIKRAAPGVEILPTGES